MFNIFKNFTSRNIPQKISFGRFDIKTTEHQKMVKAILANSDNCGDVICGDPKLVKNIIRYDNKIDSKTSKDYIDPSNPELCCQFYNFDKCDNCHMNK